MLGKTYNKKRYSDFVVVVVVARRMKWVIRGESRRFWSVVSFFGRQRTHGKTLEMAHGTPLIHSPQRLSVAITGGCLRTPAPHVDPLSEIKTLGKPIFSATLVFLHQDHT
jgi:hypothetical protein